MLDICKQCSQHNRELKKKYEKERDLRSATLYYIFNILKNGKGFSTYNSDDKSYSYCRPTEIENGYHVCDSQDVVGYLVTLVVDGELYQVQYDISTTDCESLKGTNAEELMELTFQLYDRNNWGLKKYEK